MEDARRAVLKMNGNIADGTTPRRKKGKADRARWPISGSVEAFKGSRERRPSTQTDYEFLWRDHVPAGLKRKAVVDIETSEAAKQALGKKHRTANKVVVFLLVIRPQSRIGPITPRGGSSAIGETRHAASQPR